MSQKDVVLDAILSKVNEQIYLIQNSESYKELVSETVNHILDDSGSWDLYQEFLRLDEKHKALAKQKSEAENEVNRLGALLASRTLNNNSYYYRPYEVQSCLENVAKKQIEKMDHPVTRKLAELDEIRKNARLTIALATTSRQMNEAFESILSKIGITKEDLFH